MMSEVRIGKQIYYRNPVRIISEILPSYISYLRLKIDTMARHHRTFAQKKMAIAEAKYQFMNQE